MEPQPVSDSDLVSRCRQGDLSAFEVLYQRYRLPLYSYLNRLVSGQSQTADDLFQQTWVKVLDNLGRYSEQQRFVSWLFRIAHNTAMDHFRRDGQREMVEVTESCAVDDSGPWEDLDRQVLLDAVEAALGTLAPEQREVVLLRQRGLSFKDIAAIQKSSINTVLGRMHYAVQHLRRRLAHYR